jgi:hypothetical protein
VCCVCVYLTHQLSHKLVKSRSHINFARAVTASRAESHMVECIQKLHFLAFCEQIRLFFAFL